MSSISPIPETQTNGVKEAPNGTNSTVTDAAVVPSSDNELASKFLSLLSTSLATSINTELLKKVQTAEAAAITTEAAAAPKVEEKKKRTRRRRRVPGDEDEEEEAQDEDGENTYKVEEMKKELNKVDVVKDANGVTQFLPWDPTRTTLTGDEAPPSSHAAWVLVLRRSFIDMGERLPKIITKLDIKSPLIRQVIKSAAPTLSAAMEAEKATLNWPCDGLFRYRDHIQAAADECENPLAAEHVEVLMDLIHDEFGPQIREVEEMFPKGTTTFRVLREAFWEGELVYHPCSKRLFKCTWVDYREDREGKNLTIMGNFIDSDGENFGYVATQFKVPAFSGVQYFENLPAIPIKYLSPDARTALETKLLERGKKFAALKGQHYREYDGIAMTLSYDDKPLPFSVTSRIMVDTATFNRLETSFSVDITLSSSIPSDPAELSKEQLMLCSDKIPIFSFRDKKFFIAKIIDISDIVFNPNVFNQLVLPEAHKDLVRVLVENHSKGASFDDFVAGKGKGLISVLHGPPGVGKTMTAEAVSEHTKRPLYIVTSGELGSTPSEMETQLERVLDLAKTFRAVLLLDEADVFLEQRTTHDLVRNALVSIFLRQLEYYQGILFLTTNRVATFDEAFHSRIHISLCYSALTVEAREQVWRNFGERMEGGVDLTGEDYKRFAKEEEGLNGRQIKNVFRTAQALASDRETRVGRREVEQVLGVMRAFDLKRMKE